jgi:hypothetical protein
MVCNTNGILVGNSEGERLLGISELRCVDNIKMSQRKIGLVVWTEFL